MQVSNMNIIEIDGVVNMLYAFENLSAVSDLFDES